VFVAQLKSLSWTAESVVQTERAPLVSPRELLGELTPRPYIIRKQ
jgi:hypothetical protein